MTRARQKQIRERRAASYSYQPCKDRIEAIRFLDDVIRDGGKGLCKYHPEARAWVVEFTFAK